MNEFLRKLTSISTLAGVVLAILAFCPRGSVASTIILVLFITSWVVCKLLLLGRGKGNANAKSPAGAAKRKVHTAKAKKSAAQHGIRVRRRDGSKFEIPYLDDEEELNEDVPQRLLLDSVGAHISDLLQSYYPGASWKWLCSDPLTQIVSGGVARIRLISVADLTYADISFADPKKLDIQMIRTEPLARPVKAPTYIPEPIASAPTPSAPIMPAPLNPSQQRRRKPM